ncbi:MAG: dihydroorotase [Cytophagaceae bacterium]|nr:dihydroorotase [Cytophagaceae bacterium]
MQTILIKNVFVVNEGHIKVLDVLIRNGRIEKISSFIALEKQAMMTIDGLGLFLIPGLIDAQVHFREPGLITKGTLNSESKAAVAGGITSFMDMPNTVPSTTTMELMEQKFSLASQQSFANYSFFFGLTKHNLEEALKLDNETVCGLSDDGLYFNDEEGILANYPDYLEKLFSRSDALIALHCEDDQIIKKNEAAYRTWKSSIPPEAHAKIRSALACLEATKRVVNIAKKHNTRFHVLHVSTLAEANLLNQEEFLRNKRITGEACIHHLWFSENDYEKYGHEIKWNPSIKKESDRRGLIMALKSGKLDTIATDHAPHLLNEKFGDYFQVKSGAPIVQECLLLLLELYHKGEISLEDIVQKSSHNVAEIYRIKERGYIREGYFADLVLIDLKKGMRGKRKSFYQCGWSLFDDYPFKSHVVTTFVNGIPVYHEGNFFGAIKGQRLQFEKER